ncbi:MAG: flagellar hook-basal body complex protein FliE [bacterium]|nr:flagellar hook-basal body complex protein FliE [bacterium]
MIRQISTAHQVQPHQKSGASKAIVDNFKDIFDQVNQDQIQTDHKIAEMAAGRNKDIPGTMVAMEKAETSLKLLMAVRNKVVSAYEEMMRMQV